MAGTQAGFNSAGFRGAIRKVYEMAAPSDGNEATFHFAPAVTWSGPVDGDGVAFDPWATKTETVKPSVTVPCGVEEVTGGATASTRLGDVLLTRLNVSLLDEEYEKVKGCASVTYGGETYLYHRTEPPAGLFDVGFWTLVFTAKDDR